MKTNSQKSNPKIWIGTISFTLLILVFGLPTANAQSQWTTSGNNIYYNSGNVGIGTTTPQTTLSLNALFASNGQESALITGQIGSTTLSGLYNVAEDTSAGKAGLAFKTYNAGSYATRVSILAGGNVGIGTTTPQTALSLNVLFASNGQESALVTGQSGSTTLSGLYNVAEDTSAGKVGLAFKTYNAGSYATRVSILAGGNVGIGTTPGSTYKLDVNGNTNVTGDLNVTGNLKAKFQDVAEWVPSTEQLPTGTVVVLDTTRSNQVVHSTQAYDTRIAGVVSERPGITLGESGAGKVLVATTGRVRVEVDATKGPIHIGDLLVTSDVPGRAMKSEPIKVGGRLMHMPGTLIGKALEPLEKGSGKILVLLSLQ